MRRDDKIGLRTAEPARDGTPPWAIRTPSRPGRVPGVRMAGFRDRSTDLVSVRFVPHPAVTVVVDLRHEILVAEVDGQEQRGSVAAGLGPCDARFSGARNRDFECLQVRLSPVVAHAVLRDSGELSGTVVALDDLWGRDAKRIQEQLSAAASWDDRFALVEAALARRCEDGAAVDPEVAFAWRRLVASRGRIRVERLATDCGWSRKRLWSRFRSQIGVTPKHAAQLIRFDHAAHRLAAGHSAALVAAETGYVDQSHLHRDVRTFAGMTPSAIAVTPWLTVDDIAWPSAENASSRDWHDATPTLRQIKPGQRLAPVLTTLTNND